MRLINVKTICLEEFLDDQLPKYAIVSHTWSTDEVSYEDIHSVGDSRGGQNKHPRWEKIKFACDQAKQDGLHYVWIDTCCQSISRAVVRVRTSDKIMQALTRKVALSCNRPLIQCIATTHLQPFAMSTWQT